IHDQTLRMMNQGMTAAEIAEAMRIPPALEQVWHTHGYYGSVSHNVKAIYQRYLGWFDGNPAHLWGHPPVEQARRYVECMGGREGVLSFARRYIDDGDLRFAASLLNHAVFADKHGSQARALLAEVYTRLGHGAENGTWRNFYLMGALELADGVVPADLDTAPPEVTAALTAEQIFDSLAIRINGPKAWGETLAIDWHLTDLDRHHRTTLSNGALIQQADPPARRVDLTLTLTKQQLLGLLAGEPADGIEHEGDMNALNRLTALLDDPSPAFPIVTP